MKVTGRLIEIFRSLQGEGPYVGEAMTFVRFEQCSFGCHYCDTPESFKRHTTCRVETPPRSERFTHVPNPVGMSQLNDLLIPFSDPYLSITGGEPLEQAAFLSEWLPTQAQRKKILLETNGVHPDALQTILPAVHIVSMDLKPASSTGTGKSYWNEHAAFLKLAVEHGKDVYVKIVVTGKLNDADVEQAIRLVNDVDRSIPVILQPVTPTLTFHHAVSEERLRSIEQTCEASLPDVRVIPQMHKAWGML